MVGGGQSKVSELAGHSLVSHQNVLRLEVPMVNSYGMAILYSIQDLEKSSLGESIVTNVLPSFCDVREKIALRAVLNDNICAVRRVHDLNQGNHIRVSTGLVVQLDFSLLELSLARFQAELVESLHGIGSVGLKVHGCVHYSIGAYSKDAGQLQSSG